MCRRAEFGLPAAGAFVVKDDAVGRVLSRVLSILLLVGAALWPPASFATAPAVQYVDGRLTADLHDVQLADVLAAVAAQAGLEIRGQPPSRTISVQLDAVPLAEALPRLLGEQSFALTYDRKGGLKGVRFLAASTAEVTPPRAADQPEAAKPPDAVEGEADFATASNRPVPIEGLLGEALGSDQSTFHQIMGVALQVGDSRLRAEALRTCLRMLDDDPELDAAALRSLEAFDDAYLADWLTRIAGEHAEEVPRGMARLRSRPLRRRASAVLKILRAADPARPRG